MYANGTGTGEDTYVSVYTYLMRGGNDDNLKWPFKGTIKVSLLNQLENGQHFIEEPWSLDNDHVAASGRVIKSDRARCGRGQQRFIPHQDLDYKDTKHCQYLKASTVFFRVDSIKPKED